MLANGALLGGTEVVLGGQQEMASYLAKVHLVKDDLVGMADTPESCDECQYGDDCQRDLVVPIGARGRRGGLDEFVEFGIGWSYSSIFLLAGTGHVTLAQAPLCMSRA